MPGIDLSRHAKADGLGENVYVIMKGGLDAKWESFRDESHPGRTPRQCPSGYFLSTYITGERGIQRSDSWKMLEVVRPITWKHGDPDWAIRLFGETLPDIYNSKGQAQHAAEELAGIA